MNLKKAFKQKRSKEKLKGRYQSGSELAVKWVTKAFFSEVEHT